MYQTSFKYWSIILGIQTFIFFFHNLTCPDHLLGHKCRALRLKETKYCLTNDGLGWRNPDGLILRCVDELESKRLTVEFHAGFCGGHFAARTTAHKILRAGYYWPNLFPDVQMCISLSKVALVSVVHREAKDESFALKTNSSPSPFPAVGT